MRALVHHGATTLSAPSAERRRAGEAVESKERCTAARLKLGWLGTRTDDTMRVQWGIIGGEHGRRPCLKLPRLLVGWLVGWLGSGEPEAGAAAGASLLMRMRDADVDVVVADHCRRRIESASPTAGSAIGDDNVYAGILLPSLAGAMSSKAPSSMLKKGPPGPCLPKVV